MEEPEPNHTFDHILEWLGDSESLIPPPFLDDPYSAGDINVYPWWDQAEDIYQETINNNNSTSFSSSTPSNDITASLVPTNDPAISSTDPQLSKSSNKRKDPDDQVKKPGQNPKKNRRTIKGEQDGSEAVVLEEVVTTVKRSSGNKKGTNKGTANNCNNGNNKEGRWAEQLLNPCAAAITAGNPSRVQHLLYVINELASATGDANHRLADYGSKALRQHLSPASAKPFSPGVTFASTEPKHFQRSLLKFYEVSPWFAFPNNIANSSILQILCQEKDNVRDLHILDIGVSHGMQWPTLLEALTHRPGGPPSLVRITVVASTVEGDHHSETPFSVGPPGDNFSTRLLGFAKSLNINLQINRIENYPLHKLDAQVIGSNPEETLIACVQFRLHHLNHNSADDRTEFLRVLKSLEPRGVILSENNMDCSCSNCGDFTTGFSRRVDYLWKFLDSTSTAFKGRETEERRVMEGEAAKVLTNRGEMNEGKEKWCERMRAAGFAGEVFGEDAIDGGRALLRKYDSNWEMRVEEKDGCVELWWKGQPVSFCSLWKLDALEFYS